MAALDRFAVYLLTALLGAVPFAAYRFWRARRATAELHELHNWHRRLNEIAAGPPASPYRAPAGESLESRVERLERSAARTDRALRRGTLIATVSFWAACAVVFSVFLAMGFR